MKTIAEILETLGLESILTAYGYRTDVNSTEYSADNPNHVLVEIIKDNEWLKRQDENRCKSITTHNLILFDELLKAMDEAQDTFDDSVAFYAFDWDKFTVALFLYYATLLAICHSFATKGHDNEIVKMFCRSLQSDFKHLQKWVEPKVNFAEEEWINRGKQFARNARGTVFDAIEDAVAENLRNSGFEEGAMGLVAHYVPVCDKSTCLPCKTSEGYYLLTEGPFPGRVCKGKSRCRCRRVVEHNPNMHATLIKEASSIGTENVG
jgi:hypothetical protein